MSIQKYWIIYSHTKRAVWKRPYLTLAEARQEYERNHLDKSLANWVIEEQERIVYDEGKKSKVDQEFENF